MNRSSLISCVLLVLAALVLSGCGTHTLVAKKYPTDSKLLPDLKSDNAIYLANNQKDTSQVLFGKNVGHKFQGDLNQFTKVAIDTMQEELEKKDIAVNGVADKVLGISVTKVSFESRWSGFWCQSVIKVETGDGYSAEIDGRDSNAFILYPCIHGSLNHAVTAVLNDDGVIEYINR